MDELYMQKQKEDQELLNDQCDESFDTIKRAYKMGFIDRLTFMELQVKSPEYKRLKNGTK